LALLRTDFDLLVVAKDDLEDADLAYLAASLIWVFGGIWSRGIFGGGGGGMASVEALALELSGPLRGPASAGAVSSRSSFAHVRETKNSETLNVIEVAFPRQAPQAAGRPIAQWQPHREKKRRGPVQRETHTAQEAFSREENN
jgi:hypothetical protein